MKIRIRYITAVLAGLVALLADVAAQTNPLPSLEIGQGLRLNFEQRVQRREQMQTTLAELRSKKAAGTINAQEQAWLDKAEERGGFCVTGVPMRGVGRAITPQAAGETVPVCPAIAALNAKKTAGKLDATDQALLEQLEQNGMPRGGRQGRHGGRGMGFGRGCGTMNQPKNGS